MPLQDVLITAASARTVDDALAMTYAVYQAAADLCARKYGSRSLVADEGGLAPNFSGTEAALDDAVTAIRAAGFEPGREIALCIDVASSHFFSDGRYHLDGASLSSTEMIDRVAASLGLNTNYAEQDGRLYAPIPS